MKQQLDRLAEALSEFPFIDIANAAYTTFQEFEENIDVSDVVMLDMFFYKLAPQRTIFLQTINAVCYAVLVNQLKQFFEYCKNNNLDFEEFAIELTEVY